MSVPGPESVEPQGPSQEAAAANPAAAEWAAAMAPEGSVTPPDAAGAGTNEVPIIIEGAQQPDAAQPLETPASSEPPTDGLPAPIDIDRIPWRPAAKEHVLRFLGGAPLSGATTEPGAPAPAEASPTHDDGDAPEPAEGTVPSLHQTSEPLSTEPEPGESAPENAPEPEPAEPDTVPVLEELTERDELQRRIDESELAILRDRAEQMENMAVAAQARKTAQEESKKLREEVKEARAQILANRRKKSIELYEATQAREVSRGLPVEQKAEFAEARHDAIKARFDDAVDRLVHSDTPKNVQLEMLVPYDVRMSWNRPGEKIHTFTISEYTKGYNDPSTSQTKYVVVPESQMGGWLLNSTSMNDVDAHRKGKNDELYTNKTGFIIDELGRNWGGGFHAYRAEDGPVKLGLVLGTKGSVERNLQAARDLETDKFLTDETAADESRQTQSFTANRVLWAIKEMESLMARSHTTS